MKKCIFSSIALVCFMFTNRTVAQTNFVKPTISIGIIAENLTKSIDFLR